MNNKHKQIIERYNSLKFIATNLIVIAISLTSCEKLFDVIPPDVKITDPTEGSNLKVGKTTAIKIDALKNQYSNKT